jgi:hypothetical protein
MAPMIAPHARNHSTATGTIPSAIMPRHSRSFFLAGGGATLGGCCHCG